MTSRERLVVAYTSGVHGLVHVLELSYAVLLSRLEAEFGSGLFLLGFIANLSALAFGATAIPSGFLADRIGPKKTLGLALFGAMGATVLVALSPSVVWLAVGLTILGLAIGLYHPAGMAFIARSVQSRARAYGYHGMAGNTGVALAPVLVGSIAAISSWRVSYLALGALSLVMVLVVLRSRIPEGTASEPASSDGDGEAGGRGGRFLTLPLLTVYVLSVFTGFIYRGSVTFLPLYLEEEMQLSVFNVSASTLAASFATIALLFGVPGQYLGGRLAEVHGREGLLVPVMAVVALALLLVGISSGAFLIVVATLFAFFHFMGQPIYNTLIADYTPARFQGRSYGLSFFCTFGLGSFAATFSGYLAETFGTRWVFLALAAVALLVLVLAFSLWVGTRSKGREEARKGAAASTGGGPS